jgi:pectin methylesterase-like acyl-CoA thioesterase
MWVAMLALPVIAPAAITLNLDVNKSVSTHYTGTAIAPDVGTYWNSFVVPAAPSMTLTGLRDSSNNASSTSITISRNSGSSFSVWDGSGANGNPNPFGLMRDYLFSGPYTATVSNLPAGTYHLFVYAHGDNTGQASSVAVAAGNGGASGDTTDTGEYRNIYQAGALGNSYLKLLGTVSGSGVFTFTSTYLNGFQLQILSPPTLAGLSNQTVVASTAAVLSPTTINGTPPPFLQWRSNNVALAGQTNSSLVLNNVQYAQNGTVYSLVATNVLGAATNSMVLSVIVTPSIAGLNNQAVPTGSTVTIAPTVSGVPAPTLQWLHNGVLSDGPTGSGSTLSGSTTSTLTITNAQSADSGTYALVASNSAGVVTNSMTLTVSTTDVPPDITGPTDQTVIQGSNATFAASVSGLPLPSLQWRMNGTDIPGAMNSALTVTNVQYALNGNEYSLVASNAAGAKTNSATLSVLVPSAITQHPTNLIVTVGTLATFNVTASGVPTVKYQWRKNGTPIANATNAAYTVANPQGADNGAVFSVLISNSVSSVTSSNATLTVLSLMTGTFLPTNGAANIAPDQQLRIVFSSAPKIGSGKLYVRDAANGSLFATIDTSQFQTFPLFGATITNAGVRSVQGANYYYMPLAVYGNEAWITLNSSNRFAYNKTYYVNTDAGLFRDAANASFPAITGTNTWRFSTKPSGPATPTASTGPTNLTVALDGAGDFATLQGASDWVPQNNTLKRTITILPGTYRDNSTFAQNRNQVTVMGAGTNRQAVQLFYPYPAFSSASGAGTLRLESSDLYVRNLTIDNAVYLNFNGVTFAGPIQTVQTTGSRLIFDNVLIKGGQDTLYTISGIAYFNRCEIWGSVDFIYGAALAVFDQCDIVEIRDTGGPIGAPNTSLAAPYGLTFLNCNFPRALTANGYPYNVNTGSTTMMRPWRQDGYMAVINCAMGSQVSTKGWSEWGNRHTTCRAREIGTTLIGGGTVTPAQRQAAGAYWLNTIDPDYVNDPSIDPDADPEMSLLIPPSGTNNRVAVILSTNDFTLEAIFGHPYYNLGSWRPTVMPTITAQPTNKTVAAGSPASFSVAATGLPNPAYQWRKNGVNIPGATNATLSIASAALADNGTYSVAAANSAGQVTSANAVLTVPATSTPLTPSLVNGQLTLTWPTSQTGSRLLTQTNAPGLGLTTNWHTVANSTATNQMTFQINADVGSVFFQLTYP